MNPFTQEHEMFRRSIRSFVEKEINPFVDRWEEAGIFPAHELFKKMGELGFLGLNYEEEYGGAAVDFWFTVILAEELGRADCFGVPMGIAVHTNMCTPALAQYGSHKLKKKFLEPSIRGEMVGALAVTEPDAGSDVAAIATKAQTDLEDYVINGTKSFITNGTQADWVCLLARTSPGTSYKGMSLFCVPTNTPGFSVSQKLRKLGNRSSDTAVLSLENVRVPNWYRIGEEGKGFYLQMNQFQRERLVGSVMATSMMERTVSETVEYCRIRKVFGGPLLSNQWVHFKLAELLTEIESLRRLNYYGASLLEAKANEEEITLIASMCKLKAGRLSREVADTCLQFYGGMGYMEETRISRVFRDLRLLSIGGGADEVMLGIIAKVKLHL